MTQQTCYPTRRRVLGGAVLGAAALGAVGVAGQWPQPAAAATGGPPPQPVELPPFLAATEQQSDRIPTPLAPEQRLGFAVVGLGRLALEELLPAFGACKKAKVTALVSGSRDKALNVARQYGVPETHLYDYGTYDRLRDNPDVDIIYIVLPNGMHAEYTIRGARAGKHILCEKPMATSSADCRAMIDACKAADRKLMIAYRCQYEPYNRAMIDLARNRTFGEVKAILASNGQNMAHNRQWRFDRTLAGGGALPDVGIYCLNAARYITGEEPVEVFGMVYSTPGDDRFREVEEEVAFTLRFPSGVIASCSTSYGYHQSRRYRVLATDGWFDLDPAFSYRGLQMRIGHQEGKAEAIAQRRYQEVNQFALEMDHMATCILENRQPHTPGEEGLQDQVIMEAIYRSAAEGRPVALPVVNGRDVTRGPAPQEA